MAIAKKSINFECQRKVPIAFPVVTYFDIFFNHILFFNLDARSTAFFLERHKFLIRLFTYRCFCENKMVSSVVSYSESVELAEMNSSELSLLALQSITSRQSLRRHWWWDCGGTHHEELVFLLNLNWDMLFCPSV